MLKPEMRELTLSSILIAACLLSISVAFKCHQCNSFTDPSCEHITSNDTLKECDLSEDEDTLVQIQSSNCSTSVNETEDCTNKTISMLSSPVETVNFTICRKIVTSVYGKFAKEIGDTQVTTEHKKSRVTRQCGHVRAPAEEAYQDNACVSRRNGGSHQLTCSCTKEGCNGAERMGLTTLTLLLIPLSSRLLRF